MWALLQTKPYPRAQQQAGRAAPRSGHDLRQMPLPPLFRRAANAIGFGPLSVSSRICSGSIGLLRVRLEPPPGDALPLQRQPSPAELVIEDSRLRQLRSGFADLGDDGQHVLQAHRFVDEGDRLER